MTATSNVSNSPVLSNDLLAAVNPSTSSTTTDPNSVAAQQNQFLTLLSTQLQNQDPLNPMDNAQLTSQLAQLSTVTGINTLNATVTSLAASLSASQVTSSANMIGHGVLTKGTALALVATPAVAATDTAAAVPASASAIYGVNLGTAADDVQVTISDSTGKLVKTIDLGAQPAGAQPFGWNGIPDGGTTPLAAGNYTIAVSATAGGVALTDATSLTYSTVASVSNNASGTQLTLVGNGSSGTNSQVSLSDVAVTM
jgi:flagellar basal-body rod modification protein FlgD